MPPNKRKLHDEGRIFFESFLMPIPMKVTHLLQPKVSSHSGRSPHYYTSQSSISKPCTLPNSPVLWVISVALLARAIAAMIKSFAPIKLP